MGYHKRALGCLTEIEKYFICFLITFKDNIFRYFPYHQRTSVLTTVYDNGLRQQDSNYYNKVIPTSSGL